MKTKMAFVSIIIAAIMMSACIGVNHLGVLDEKIPEENRCFLEVRNDLTVVLFNNQPVSWSPGLTKNAVSIYLPPGNHTFMVRWIYVENAGSMHARNVDRTATVSMEFQPGRSYQIYKQKIWLIFFTIESVKIKETKSK